ncbi:NADH-quinone oxidoreductase subunit NuoN [Campylobacter sp. RM16187]|uniref:NADH-quinone oxidoreductase subunit NuoN n=1 Tax=Campylobacter sp. RM16187 TaxID=1660063 RepID=UPI0021B672B5|nr:NADH-quinone oxidoreductase subunit NuoN [Campylobacter sp. RM16187]QKG29626.1 NADH:quinone oxidoreductase I, membrane subunit N [Campylobacter sp. RM16187]
MNELVFVSLAELNISSVASMLSLIFFALLILCISTFKKDLSKTFYTVLCLIAIMLNLGIVIDHNILSKGFFDLLLVDGISVLSQIIILIASSLFIPLSLSTKRFFEYEISEFYALFLFMIAGFEFMVSSNNLILIFIGLETSSLALYTLIALHNKIKSIEAAIKYFTMGALGSGFFVFGAAMFYMATGSVEINLIADVIKQSGLQGSMIATLGCVFMFGAIGFKLSLIPFHTWVPDVYEGANSPLAGYMSVVPKVAGFIVALRLFEALAHSDIYWVHYMLYISAILTMTLANIMALVQRDVKRMLAFSSIAHAGFVLCAIVIGTSQANVSLFLYWIMFLFANLGAFSMLWVARCDDTVCWDKRFKHPYEKFAGLIKTLPNYAVIMAIFMVALAGIPPFSVFWGKMYLISSAIAGNHVVLAVVMALNSAIAIYYYLKLVVVMFLKEPIVSDKNLYIANTSGALKAIVGFAAITTIGAIFMIDSLLEFIASFVIASGF